MRSFAEKHCGSSLSSWLIVDTLLISKLFTPFVPVCSQFRLYICYLGEFVKNKTHRFQCFSTMTSLLKGSIPWFQRFFFLLWREKREKEAERERSSERKLLIVGDSWLILPHQSENWGQDLTLSSDWRNISLPHSVLLLADRCVVVVCLLIFWWLILWC